MSWNGASCKRFMAKNGVKQGGVLSPVLFWLYFVGLFKLLAESNVRPFSRSMAYQSLAYTDDMVLLAPTARAMHLVLKIGDEHAEFCLCLRC